MVKFFQTKNFVWDMHADVNNAGVAEGMRYMGRQVIGQSNRNAGEPRTEPIRIRHLIATISHTRFDVGELRLVPGAPREIAQTMTSGEPIPGVLARVVPFLGPLRMEKVTFRPLAAGFTIALLFSSILDNARGESPPSLPTVLKAEPMPAWNAKFAGEKGWIGGDGAYSTPLDARRVLWLFGDTLVGEVKQGRRDGAAMVNNTLGVQNGREGKIRFYWGKPKEGKPAAIFRPADGKGWFWPQAALRVGERLFVFLPQIDKTKEGGVFGFRHIGQWLAVVDNPDDEPAAWRVKQQKLPFVSFEKETVRSWGSALLQADGHIYIYGYAERDKKIGARKLLVARVAMEKLADFSAWRFRTADGWSERAAEATPLAGGLATEFSVGRMANRKQYALVYTENGLSDRIVARFAGAPAGPWSAPLELYKCPETGKDKGVFCYAAKAHPWAAGESELIIGYCTNVWEFARLFREAKVYRPQFVRVKLQAAK
jgi:hypothetical protein